ncbi:MAG: hypothetical protein KFKLKKLM_00690 [Flavobacteriales bacterium]|nr:hypothetical protein [Flavobacteriales bacterium]
MIRGHNTSVDFAKKLHLLRRLNDKKQAEIADFLGVTQQAYSKLERGEVIFTDDVIDKICTFFDVPVSEFISSDYKINCVNSPNSNNHNNQNSLNGSIVTEQLLQVLIEEVHQSRDERKFYLQVFQSFLAKK